MLPSDIVFIIAYLSLLFGILIRGLVPYFRKKAIDEALTFATTYIGTIILALIFSIYYLSTIIVPIVPETLTVEFIIRNVVAPNVAAGIGISWGINELVSIGKTFIEAEKKTP